MYPAARTTALAAARHVFAGSRLLGKRTIVAPHRLVGWLLLDQAGLLSAGII